MDRAELVDLLNTLLEAERAGAKGVGAMAREAEDAPTAAALRAVAEDEARFCAMLAAHVRRLGGTPSRQTGAFAEKLLALPGLEDRLNLLDRGQGWVVRRLHELLPALVDDALAGDLSEMLETHERNIARCAALAGADD